MYYFSVILEIVHEGTGTDSRSAQFMKNEQCPRARMPRDRSQTYSTLKKQQQHTIRIVLIFKIVLHYPPPVWAPQHDSGRQYNNYPAYEEVFESLSN